MYVLGTLSSALTVAIIPILWMRQQNQHPWSHEWPPFPGLSPGRCHYALVYLTLGSSVSHCDSGCLLPVVWWEGKNLLWLIFLEWGSHPRNCSLKVYLFCQNTQPTTKQNLTSSRKGYVSVVFRGTQWPFPSLAAPFHSSPWTPPPPARCHVVQAVLAVSPHGRGVLTSSSWRESTGFQF